LPVPADARVLSPFTSSPPFSPLTGVQVQAGYNQRGRGQQLGHSREVEQGAVGGGEPELLDRPRFAPGAAGLPFGLVAARGQFGDRAFAHIDLGGLLIDRSCSFLPSG
jgi:hypothetical protein